jgi:hypothetical protein
MKISLGYNVGKFSGQTRGKNKPDYEIKSSPRGNRKFSFPDMI